MPDNSDVMGAIRVENKGLEAIDNGDGTWTYTFKAPPLPLHLTVPAGPYFIDAQTGELVNLREVVAEMIAKAREEQP